VSICACAHSVLDVQMEYFLFIKMFFIPKIFISDGPNYQITKRSVIGNIKLHYRGDYVVTDTNKRLSLLYEHQ
jgi:hypothetical protein